MIVNVNWVYTAVPLIISQKLYHIAWDSFSFFDRIASFCVCVTQQKQY